MTGMAADQNKEAVEATLRRIANIDPTVADIVRLQLGPDTTWNRETPAKALALSLQASDGRAG